MGEEEPFKRITQALSRWHEDLKQWPADEPCNAVIEIADNGVYVELIDIQLNTGQSLQLRAANGARPAHSPAGLAHRPARLAHSDDGAGQPLHVGRPAGHRPRRALQERAGTETHPEGRSPRDLGPATIHIRHCTLVPGWGLHNDCKPRRPAEPSLELFNVRPG